jgi:beta-glucosidase
VAWNLYIPAWLRDYQIAPELLSRDVAYINDTPSLVPYGDRYNTGVEVTGVKAHPTLGAVFAVLFAAEPPVATTVTPGSVLLIPGQASEVTLANTNTDGGLLTVDWAAAPPAGSGITVTPASGSVSLIRGATASTTLTVAASPAAPSATVTVPVNVTASAGGTSFLCPGSYLQVLIPYQSLAAAFDNVGVTEDSDPSPGNFDGYGNSFSATALADAGITPGSPVTSGGVTFTWPDVAPGEPDNVVASGQTIAVSGSGSTLGFLGVANNGVASGMGTIGYTDGSTQSFTIGFQNWIDATPADGDALVATTSYFNRTTPGAARTPSLFSASVPLQTGKTVASVTLPDVSSTTVSTSTTSMHIFAIGIG